MKSGDPLKFTRYQTIRCFDIVATHRKTELNDAVRNLQLGKMNGLDIVVCWHGF